MAVQASYRLKAFQREGTMKGCTRFLVVSLFIWLSAVSPAVFAQPAINPVADFFNRLAAGQGNSWAQRQVQSAAVAQGMRDLVQMMETNGHDPHRAMMTYLQTPRGQALMKVPGALPALIENFNKVMALPSARQ
jgi:hypothetical protein